MFIQTSNNQISGSYNFSLPLKKHLPQLENNAIHINYNHIMSNIHNNGIDVLRRYLRQTSARKYNINQTIKQTQLTQTTCSTNSSREVYCLKRTVIFNILVEGEVSYACDNTSWCGTADVEKCG
jgi:hypothetical protein